MAVPILAPGSPAPRGTMSCARLTSSVDPGPQQACTRRQCHADGAPARGRAALFCVLSCTCCLTQSRAGVHWGSALVHGALTKPPRALTRREHQAALPLCAVLPLGIVCINCMCGWGLLKLVCRVLTRQPVALPWWEREAAGAAAQGQAALLLCAVLPPGLTGIHHTWGSLKLGAGC